MIRIANAQGFWGDWLEAPVRLVEGGPIDYLTLDYLAEVTMSILQKQRARNPADGYARDFVGVVAEHHRNLQLRRGLQNRPRACHWIYAARVGHNFDPALQ